MALVRGAEPAPGPSRWLPTHVQVTVLRARGLRGKSSGAGSTSDAYTVIQVGREKYSTSVVEKTPGCPEWREECSFELPPGALDGLLRAQEADAGSAPWAAGSAAACELVLTTMHRSLIGVDKFLGQATVALDEVFGAGRAQHTQWYKLHSKAGKKEKERGEIQVTIQFTRNNLSASMFDLSMKDKPRSPFSKIKDKMKGKKKFDLESASAILPSSALEDPELGSLGKMGKAKGFFLRNKLRKSSLTQSNTSLGSDSTLSSASGSLAYQGPGTELLTHSPSRSSWLSTEGGRDSTQSPKLLTHKRTYSDEASQMRVAPPRSLLDLQGHLDAASRSSLCVNGSHIYNEEPQAPLRHRSSISGPFPPSSSLHSVSFRPAEEGSRPTDDSGGRGSRSTSSSEMLPGQEELSSQAKVLATGTSRSGEEEGARLPEGKPVQVATPLVASSESVAEKEGARKEERKPRMGLFHHHHQGLSRSELGRRGSLGEKGGPTQGASPHHSSGGEEKAKSSWFGLREAKEPTQKPSASRASPTPLASPGKAPPEWEDTFNVFAASRLRPEARSKILAPAGGVGLEVTGLQEQGRGVMTVKASEPRGDPGGGGRGGSSVRLEPRMPLDLGLDRQSSSVADPGPLGSVGPILPSTSAQQHLRASDSEADREPPAPGGEAGQSPADSATSLFSSPEVISVWERLPGTDDTPEGQEEASQGEGQLLHELNTVEDSWPWDVVTISPAAEMSSLVLRGESDELPPPQMQPESPEPVSPRGSEGPPPLKLEPEPEPELEPEAKSKPEQVSDRGPQPSRPPPKPPRLFTPSDSQEKEEDEAAAVVAAAGGLRSRGAETGGEDDLPSTLVAGPQEAEEEGETPGSESDSHSSGTLLGGPGLEDVVEGISPPVSGPSLSLPTGCPEGPTPRPSYSKLLAPQSQQIWGAPEKGESPEGPDTQIQGPVGEGLESLPGSSQHTGLCTSEEDALNPFLSQRSQDPPSLPFTSPPGSRDSSIVSGPEELPTPPEPAFPPPPLPPWASHCHGGPSPPCSPLPGARPLTSSSPTLGEPASSPGGSPAPLGEDHAATIPASPLVLLPLETRLAEEPQSSASPHPVKPLSAASLEGSPDKKQSRSSLSTALSSGLEKLKTVTSGSVQPVAPAPHVGQTVDTKRLKDSGVLDQSAKYYHLTHDELISLLLQRERELSQRDEHVQELESYIDRLLVRIMETSPTLLQIPPDPPK
ncbi:rab11 family-interacting protein 5 isoform X2 [Canis lupus familiaris]|uniref:rab11 family-interacting protein 5 isoform X2 n=1 Tax=Canis lupus familiaris TaxID=9615 RepID=UPI0003ADBD90|nr:rab11 family-interacting protein 5 isoform X2 [Canis lupus familiaris]XP_038547655.1 rab11 family-interacting protein 5 isoform X2 [Canis lupus familiaris]|eukprot:XP_005630626.1 rab11 family-interacting protein 5 isoform X2 [Canis lupus familiaris]